MDGRNGSPMVMKGVLRYRTNDGLSSLQRLQFQVLETLYMDFDGSNDLVADGGGSFRDLMLPECPGTGAFTIIAV